MDVENIAPSKHFSLEDKRIAIELWKAKVPLKSIRDQLSMSESTQGEFGPLQRIRPSL
jgi:hypothetical protein